MASAFYSKLQREIIEDLAADDIRPALTPREWEAVLRKVDERLQTIYHRAPSEWR